MNEKLPNAKDMEKVIKLKILEPTALLGVGDAHLKLLESVFPATIVIRGEIIKIRGNEPDVISAHEVLHEMIQTLSGKGSLSIRDVRNLITLVKSEENQSKDKSAPDIVIHFGRKGVISPKTEGQRIYVQEVEKSDIVFSIGPAGTGKTFLSVAFAVAALQNHEVERIILSRPAVEAGENLGFLPGDLKEKVDPYLSPLYDALGSMFPSNKLKPLLESKTIEVVPLAYMRGRTLDNAFLILDEAQNSTVMQMKMFLTRLGINSKAIVTGDVTQIDLQRRLESGLVQAAEILKDVDGIGFVYLDETDVVRHNLVRKIIRAYERTKNRK